MFPLCLRVPWLAGPRLPRPGLLSNIKPRGRSARTRHRSRHEARFSHCLVGGWTTNRPGRSEGETRAKASSTASLAVFAERSPPRQAYRVTSTRVQPRACTSGCKKVHRRWSFGKSALSARWPPIGSPISHASKFDTTLLYTFVWTVFQACAHPCADMAPNTIRVRQYGGLVCAHGRC